MALKDIPLRELTSLADRRAIVTGGARGIGFAICHRLAEAGARLLVPDIDALAAREAADKLKGLGAEAHAVACDVSKEEEVRDMVALAVKKMGGVDIVVNNAGIYPRIPFPEMTGSIFERVLSVNLTGTFLCSRYAGMEMIKQATGGCIINLASIEALHPSSTGMSAYDASKAGILMLTKSMARELGRHGIRVNAVAPGAIKTAGVRSHLSGMPEKRVQLAELKSFMARIVLGHMGDSDDVARVVLFLASDLASYITGEIIVVDGGYLLS